MNEPVVAPAPSNETETDDQRRLRFETRATASTPNELPPPWRRLLKRLDARLLKAKHRVWSYQTDWRGGRRIELKARVFGDDESVDARIYSALEGLKLPKLAPPLKDQTVESKRAKWSVSIDRVVAPKGAQRETQLDLVWARQPKPNEKKRGDCRKPHPVAAPATAPEWLAKATRKMSTRRRIVAESATSTKREEARIQVLYHNGFAHDENVGQLTASAAKAGLRQTSGSGPRQTWSHPDGRRMTLRPVRDVHDMGCKIRGPVLEVRWRGSQVKRSKQ